MSAPADPLSQLRAMILTAEQFGSEVTSVVARDADGKILSAGVVATGEEAIALERWLKRRAKRDNEEPDAVAGAANTPARCDLCNGTGYIGYAGYCDCAMGRDLRRIESGKGPAS